MIVPVSCVQGLAHSISILQAIKEVEVERPGNEATACLLMYTKIEGINYQTAGLFIRQKTLRL